MSKDIKFVGLVIVGVLLSGVALMLLQELISKAGNAGGGSSNGAGTT